MQIITKYKYTTTTRGVKGALYEATELRMGSRSANGFLGLFMVCA